MADGNLPATGRQGTSNVNRASLTKSAGALERLPDGGVFTPREKEEARERRLEFFAELEKQIDQGDYVPLEVQSYFKRDLLPRVVFSDRPLIPVITLAQSARSIAWAKHQLNVRRTLWPEGIGSQTEQMERKLQRLARERGPMSDRDFRRYANVDSPGSGGIWTAAVSLPHTDAGRQQQERCGQCKYNGSVSHCLLPSIAALLCGIIAAPAGCSPLRVKYSFSADSTISD
jgi:hypothetical protein